MRYLNSFDDPRSARSINDSSRLIYLLFRSKFLPYELVTYINISNKMLPIPNVFFITAVTVERTLVEEENLLLTFTRSGSRLDSYIQSTALDTEEAWSRISQLQSQVAGGIRKVGTGVDTAHHNHAQHDDWNENAVIRKEEDSIAWV